MARAKLPRGAALAVAGVGLALATVLFIFLLPGGERSTTPDLASTRAHAEGTPAAASAADASSLNLTDQQLADIAALHLRRTLEQGYEATVAELFLGGEQLLERARECGYL